MPTEIHAVCTYCFTPFITYRGRGVYCSHACRNSALREKCTVKREAWPLVKCPECGTEFRRALWYGEATTKFCSPKCWYAYFRKHPEVGGKWRPPNKTCLGCGQVFKGKRYGSRQFCSWQCYTAFNVRQNRTDWKGGRKIHPNGYVYVNGGPNRWVAEHRVVMEKILGRPLAPDECVDHIDGDRANNGPENLRVMTKSEHAKMHMAGFVRPKIKKPRCGNTPSKEGKFRALSLGSTCLHGGGYIQVKTPDGWVLEHRIIAARVLGRSLFHGEVVHHIDGDKTNNDPSNLKILESQATHNKLTKPHLRSPVTKAGFRRQFPPIGVGLDSS